ncbi:MAG: hypothetical protein HY908_26915 [Myxococcales bacterium]|nr:hypothetical protein [Myxococcales bacterium]
MAPTRSARGTSSGPVAPGPGKGAGADAAVGGVARSAGPGLQKARPRAVTWRSLTCAALPPDYWQRLIETADVVSEGGVSVEGDQSVYYGTTSVLCELGAARRDGCGAAALGLEVESALAALAAADPHVRLRLLRIARREAQARAPAPLGVLHAELAAHVRGSCLCIEATVSAPVLAVTRGARRRH